MKTYGGSGCVDSVSLTSARVGGEWSASRPGRFIPEEEAPGTNFYRGLGGLQSRSERCGEMKESSFPHRDSNSDPLLIQLVGSRYTDCAVPVLYTAR
jgi:hypothetical protein